MLTNFVLFILAGVLVAVLFLIVGAFIGRGRKTRTTLALECWTKGCHQLAGMDSNYCPRCLEELLALRGK